MNSKKYTKCGAQKTLEGLEAVVKPEREKVLDQFGYSFEGRHSEAPRFPQRGEESRAQYFKL